MPEPVSIVIGLTLAGGTMLTNLNRQNLSVSESGQYLRDQAALFKDYSSLPVSLDTQRHSALTDLQELIEEHSVVGWDGDQAPALSALTVENTRIFLSALPKNIPDPEFAVEPDDGAISLEWYGGYRKVVSVSIHESQRLAFAALQGTDVSNGAYRFDEEHIPATVLSTIREITA